MQRSVGGEPLSAVNMLLDIKMNASEAEMKPRVLVLNQYIEEVLPELKSTIEKLPSGEEKSFAELDRLFTTALKGEGSNV